MTDLGEGGGGGSKKVRNKVKQYALTKRKEGVYGLERSGHLSNIYSAKRILA